MAAVCEGPAAATAPLKAAGLKFYQSSQTSRGILHKLSTRDVFLPDGSRSTPCHQSATSIQRESLHFLTQDS
ncbi:hypothetical protein E2C01_073145 [Portunus trituberculatus]|uniref:Uncharacterized protein n=1 Tax=Portunus trituberculatus TaxID=210409 RepID=A0A5B7I004_PORTR|nr:hypothetical protein [Portunus trituberculatus]